MKLSSVFAATLSTLTVSVLTTLGFSSQAQGLTFSGTSSGIWGEPIPGSINTAAIYSGVNTNTFTWGQSLPDDPNFGTPANRLTFTGESPFSGDVNAPLKIGELEYFNGIVPLGTGVEFVPLNLSLSFTEPITVDEDFVFGFQLVNTPNVGTDEENADSVIVTNQLGGGSFTFNGTQYKLDLVGFSQDGGNTAVTEFRVLEKATTTAGLYARIKPVSAAEKIPEPMTVVGLSALGVYLISRKKTLRDNHSSADSHF